MCSVGGPFPEPELEDVRRVRQHFEELVDSVLLHEGVGVFLALKVHNDTAAEIYVIGVLPEHHHHGIGTALVEDAENLLRAMGVEYLQVKTLGPSEPSEHYAATRRFYESRAFRPLEELTAIWGEENPCLIMVKRL